MPSTSSYVSILCILLHQVQMKDMMAPITLACGIEGGRGLCMGGRGGVFMKSVSQSINQPSPDHQVMQDSTCANETSKESSQAL